MSLNLAELPLLLRRKRVCEALGLNKAVVESLAVEAVGPLAEAPPDTSRLRYVRIGGQRRYWRMDVLHMAGYDETGRVRPKPAAFGQPAIAAARPKAGSQG